MADCGAGNKNGVSGATDGSAGVRAYPHKCVNGCVRAARDSDHREQARLKGSDLGVLRHILANVGVMFGGPGHGPQAVVWRLTPWRYVARARAVVLWAYIVGMGAEICLDLDTLNWRPFFTRITNVVCLYVVVVFIAHGIYRHYRRKFCKRLTESHFDLCTNCGYSLQGLPDEHICPECSAAYSREEIAAKWKNWALDVGWPPWPPLST